MKSKTYILSLATISLLALSACSSSNTKETATEIKNTQQNTTEQSDETTKKVNYDIAAMNVKIADSFNESVQFNQDGADGYGWTTFITNIELNENEAIHAIVSDNFSLLTDEEKTEVLNRVSSTVNMVVFLETEIDKSYFITAHNSSGDKVAQSKITDVLEYKFY